MQDYPVYHEEGLQNGARNFGIIGEVQGQPSNHQNSMYQSNGRNVGIAAGTPPSTGPYLGPKYVRVLDGSGTNMYAQQQS